MDITKHVSRVEAVCALAKRFYKTFPMAVISNDNLEDTIQLLTSVGLLHLFDVVIAQSSHRKSLVDIFSDAASRLNQRVDTCIGVAN